MALALSDPMVDIYNSVLCMGYSWATDGLQMGYEGATENNARMRWLIWSCKNSLIPWRERCGSSL